MDVPDGEKKGAGGMMLREIREKGYQPPKALQVTQDFTIYTAWDRKLLGHPGEQMDITYK